MTVRLEIDPRAPLGYRLVTDDPASPAQDATEGQPGTRRPTASTRSTPDLAPTEPLDGAVRGGLVESRAYVEAFQGGAWHRISDPTLHDVTEWTTNEWYNEGDLVIVSDGAGGWDMWRAGQYMPAPSSTPSEANGWEPVGGGDDVVPVVDTDTRGFTFVQDTAPTPTRVGDTWFDTSTAASGGTSWTAIEEGAAGSEKVWVQFAPGPGGLLANYPLGIVALGTMIAYEGVGFGAGVSTPITQTLSFTPLTGRRYRLVCMMRAIGGNPPTGFRLSLAGTNSITKPSETWTWVGGEYTQANYQAIFDGNGTAATFVMNAIPYLQQAVLYTSPPSHFYLEDVGPVR